MAKKAKLPVAQLAIMSICRFAEPVALTSVFPYLPEMIESFHVSKTDVPTWAGTTSAVFSISQACTGIAWGNASDRFGRKPTLLLGLFLTMCSTLMFGFSKNLTFAIISRAIAGASSGTVGITRTSVAEMVPERELQPRAFSVMPLMWSIGSILGPTLGGAFANPVKTYPQLFGNSAFFKMFPFSLPNLIACSLFLVGLTSGILYLKETLESKKNQRDYGLMLGRYLLRPFSKGSTQLGSGDEEHQLTRTKSYEDAQRKLGPAGYREILTTQSSLNLLAYTLLALHSITYDQLLPVFLHLVPQPDRATNPDVRLPLKFAGGFGLNSGRIGLLLTMNAIIAMLVQFIIFPPMAQRFGVLRCFRVVTLLFPIAYFMTPFTVLFPTLKAQQVAIFCVMIVKCIAGVFAFPCTTIMLTNSASSLRILGTLNGISVSLSAIGRAVGPAIGGAAFTLGIDLGYVIIPWWLLSFFGFLGHMSTWFLVEEDGPSQKINVDRELDKDGVSETQSLLSMSKQAEAQGKYLTFNDENPDSDGEI